MGRLGGSGVGVGVDSRVVRGHLGSVCSLFSTKFVCDVDERMDGALSSLLTLFSLDCDDREWSPKWIKFSRGLSGVKQTCQKVIVMVSKY